MELARPYIAAFSARFLLMLQYRAAAFAGFLTQCWWGAIKIMVYAAFYRTSHASTHPAITLAQVATYLCRLGQGRSWVRLGEPYPMMVPLTTAILFWAGLYLREDRLQPLLPLRRKPSE